jgi:hypothetical protein
MARVKQGKGFTMFFETREFRAAILNLRLTRNQAPRLQKFLVAEAEKIKKTALTLVPRKTHRLADSHRVLTQGSNVKRGIVQAVVVAGGKSVRGKFVNYAAAVHDGTPKMTGRPWLQRALNIHKPGFTNRMAKSVKIYGRRTL